MCVLPFTHEGRGWMKMMAGWMKTMAGMDEDDGGEGKKEVLAGMGQALQDWGFVQVKYA